MPTVTMRLSDDARKGFLVHARAHGVTLTALMEAMGRVMLAHRNKPDVIWPETVELARTIDAERRSRA